MAWSSGGSSNTEMVDNLVGEGYHSLIFAPVIISAQSLHHAEPSHFPLSKTCINDHVSEWTNRIHSY